MSRSRPTKQELAIRAQVDADLEQMKAARAKMTDAECEAERIATKDNYRNAIQQYQANVAEQKARREKVRQARALATPLTRVSRGPTKAQQARVDRLAVKVGALTAEWEERKTATLALPDGAARWERICEEDRATGRTMYRENAVRWLAIGQAQLAAKQGKPIEDLTPGA